MKKELVGMNLTELENMMESLREKAFRGRQLYRWLYKNLVFEFEHMTDLPRELRDRLKYVASVSLPVVEKEKISRDGTVKVLLGLRDRQYIEMVMIPQAGAGRHRYTLCVSSQVGCPVGCPFCATGRSGFIRNLTVDEIVGQVLIACLKLRKSNALEGQRSVERLTNVVFMGMGEPFFNYSAVMKSIRLMNDPDGLNIGQRHITVSTAGEVQGIRRLAQEGLQVTLAVSLHSARDEVRDRLVPLNRKYPLSKLQEALCYYNGVAKRRVTLEYVLLEGVNTSRQDAHSLIDFARPLLCNINLIPYNRVESAGFRRPSSSVVVRFQRWLQEAGMNSVVREERGSDIDAACGQLRAQVCIEPGRKIPGKGRRSN